MRILSLLALLITIAIGVWWTMRDIGLSPNQDSNEEFVPITQPIEEAKHVKSLIEGRTFPE